MTDTLNPLPQMSEQMVQQPLVEQVQEPQKEVLSNVELAGESVLTMYNQLTAEGAADKFKKSLVDELEDPEIVHVLRFKAQIATLSKRMNLEEDPNQRRKTHNTIQGIENEMYRMFGNAKIRLEDIQMMKQETEDSGAISVIGEGAHEMAEQLLQHDALYRSPDGVQRFIYSEHLPHIPERGNKVSIHIKLDEEPIQIPVSSIVSPAEMESWDGRRGSDISANKIKDYSERDTDIPPIKDGILGFIMPDGRIFFESQNAHRVAAAIKKGQEYIGVVGPIRLTKIDYIPDVLK